MLVQDLNTSFGFRVHVLLKRFDLRCAAMVMVGGGGGGDGGGGGGNGHLRICCLFVLTIFVQDAAAEVAKCFGPVSSPSNIINPNPLSILLSPTNSTPYHHRFSNAGCSSQGATFIRVEQFE